MNNDAVSAECVHGLHSACTFEDCACGCHYPPEDNDDPTEVDGVDYLNNWA